MYKFLFIFLAILIFPSCGIPLLDFAGRGSLYKKIYYDVTSNQIISNKEGTISSMMLWKFANDSTYTREELIPLPFKKSFTIPKLRDSIAFYDFEVSIHFENDHWRMMYHLNIDKELVKKKPKIYSRFTSH